MKKIKYDISYIRKNLDLKKFIEYLNSISKWSYQTDGTSIINSAIKACDSKKNKDPNLISTTKGLKPPGEIKIIMMVVDVDALQDKSHILDYHCFFPGEYIIKEKDGTQKLWKPSVAQIKKNKKFLKDLSSLESSGKLLSKISNNFSLIYNLKYLGEDEEGVYDVNTLYFSKIDKKYYYIWYHKSNHINEVIKVFNKSLTKEGFTEEVSKFKQSKGFKV